MPAFNVEVPHSLSRDEAVDRLKGFVEKVRQQYKDQVSSVSGNWNDNVLDFAITAYGFSLSGKVAVEEQIARLTGQLPFAALAFRGKIEQSFASELKKALA